MMGAYRRALLVELHVRWLALMLLRVSVPPLVMGCTWSASYDIGSGVGMV